MQVTVTYGTTARDTSRTVPCKTRNSCAKETPANVQNNRASLHVIATSPNPVPRSEHIHPPVFLVVRSHAPACAWPARLPNLLFLRRPWSLRSDSPLWLLA